MSTQFAFRADRVTATRPANYNHVASDLCSLIMTRQPRADPISDAINNIRFGCTGFAPGTGAGEQAVLFTLLTRHIFTFRPQATGRLTAHTHFMPQGGFSLVGRAMTWSLFDWFAGSVGFGIKAQMRVLVRAADGTMALNVLTPSVPLLGFEAEGGQVADTNEGSVDTQLLEFSISRAFETIVVPTDTVEVHARYWLQALAWDGAEFALDFASMPAAGGEPGDGLNSPFAVINIS
jgi:hypothetical protein